MTALVDSIPADQLGRRRQEGFWTVAEHLGHLAQVQPMLLERLQRFRDEAHPVFVPFVPGEGDDAPDTSAVMPAQEALDQFARWRAKQVDLLRQAPHTLWQKTGDHPEYTSYSPYILSRHILLHDYWHLYRMEELWLTRDAYLTRLA